MKKLSHQQNQQINTLLRAIDNFEKQIKFKDFTSHLISHGNNRVITWQFPNYSEKIWDFSLDECIFIDDKHATAMYMPSENSVVTSYKLITPEMIEEFTEAIEECKKAISDIENDVHQGPDGQPIMFNMSKMGEA